MPKLDLRHYKNHKRPYVGRIVKGTTSLDFLPIHPGRLSADKTYGTYQATVDKEGFYKIGNAQDDENGYRLFFATPNGNKFPFISKPELIEEIKARINRDEPISKIAQELGL
jgi:hypothetical protein